MSEPELRRLVVWTVTDEPGGRRAERLLGRAFHVLSTVATLGADAGGGTRRPSWDVPADPDGYLDLGRVELRWPATARPEPVQATRRDAWRTPAGRPPARVPVEALRVVEAVPRNRPDRSAGAEWALTVTDGTQTGTLSGAWLALAWLGHLGGWPEPAVPYS